jgi:hypothetical protein
MEPDKLRQRSDRYRRIAGGISDAMAIKALKDPADATQDPIIDCTRGRSIQFDAA